MSLARQSGTAQISSHYWNSKQFKTYELFISRIFYFIFLTMVGVTESWKVKSWRKWVTGITQ